MCLHESISSEEAWIVTLKSKERKREGREEKRGEKRGREEKKEEERRGEKRREERLTYVLPVLFWGGTPSTVQALLLSLCLRIRPGRLGEPDKISGMVQSASQTPFLLYYLSGPSNTFCRTSESRRCIDHVGSGC